MNFNDDLTHSEYFLDKLFQDPVFKNPQTCPQEFFPLLTQYKQMILKNFEISKQKDFYEGVVLNKLLEIKNLNYTMNIRIGETINTLFIATLSMRTSQKLSVEENQWQNFSNDGYHGRCSNSFDNFSTLIKKLTLWFNEVFPLDSKNSMFKNSRLN